jgi:hypothetical protein
MLSFLLYSLLTAMSSAGPPYAFDKLAYREAHGKMI